MVQRIGKPHGLCGLCRFVHDTMDVDSVESRFSEMSLSPFGGHGNYAHSDGQLSECPYKANGHSMLLGPPYAMMGARGNDSWGAQRGYERPLGNYSRPSEALLHCSHHCCGILCSFRQSGMCFLLEDCEIQHRRTSAYEPGAQTLSAVQ